MIRDGIKQCCEEIRDKLRKLSGRYIHCINDIMDVGTDYARICDLTNEIEDMLDRKREGVLSASAVRRKPSPDFDPDDCGGPEDPGFIGR